MHKGLKKTTAFFIIAILFWGALALISFEKYLTINYSADELKTITGEILSLEKRESNEFYYFHVKTCPDMNFRISYTDNISLEELRLLQLHGKKITFQVDKKSYLFNNDVGDIEVISLKCGEEIFWSIEDYCNQKKRDYVVRSIIGIIMASGMLYSLILIKKKTIIIQNM